MRRPVAFYSEDTHYSFAKAVRVLGVETFQAVGTESTPGECPLPARGGAERWPAEVPSRSGPSGHSWDGTGEIDVEALATLVEFFAAKGHPIFVSLNLGSTFKGAHDDVRHACERLLPIFERHGLIQAQVTHGRDPHTGEPLTDLRRRFWIHVDGALGAGLRPVRPDGRCRPRARLDARHRASRVRLRPDPPHPGVRRGRHGLLHRHERPQVARRALALRHLHDEGQVPDLPAVPARLHRRARHHLRRLTQRLLPAGPLGPPLPALLPGPGRPDPPGPGAGRLPGAATPPAGAGDHLELWPARTPGAITVRFRKPSPELVAKWSLSCQDVLIIPGDDSTRRSYVHVFLMSSVDRAKLDALLHDLAHDPAILG